MFIVISPAKRGEERRRELKRGEVTRDESDDIFGHLVAEFVYISLIG